MADEPEFSPPHPRDLVAELQYAQLRVRLGLAEGLQPIALDPEQRFLLLDILGAGGMGVVFLGHDTKLDRRVALKVLRRRMLAATWLEQRLMLEAQILATLQDRNILVVYDVGRSRTGDLFLATQYVDGTTMREWQVGRPLTEILDAYLEAGRGLAAAHERDVVHRDFKPENVLVEAANPAKVYVGDFGLADRPSTHDLAQRSVRGRFGTPPYMAPEQLQREPATPLSDQYSFCVALWEACSGTPPAGPSTSPPSRPPDMPRWLYRALVVGLSPRPQDRHASLALLLAHIQAARHRRRRSIATISLVGLLGVGIAIGYDLGRRPPSCDDTFDVEEPWSVTRGATLLAKLAGMPPDYAQNTAVGIVGALQSNVDARRVLEASTCEAQLLAPDEPRWSRRSQCLERWRRRSGEQLDELERLSPDKLASAHKLLAPLERLAERCAHDGVAPPLDAELQSILAGAENASLLLDHTRGVDLASDAVELAEARGRSCELGFAHHRLGRAQMLAGRATRARDELLVALEYAQSCEADLGVMININLAQLSALQLGDVDAAKQALAGARGQLDAHNEAKLSLRRAWVHETDGFIALAEGHPDQAIPSYRLALDALGGSARYPFQAARMHANIGAAQQQAGALSEARESDALARDIIATRLGLEHPEVQTHLRWVQLNEAMLARAAANIELAAQQLEPLMDAPEPAIRVRATSSWLALVFDGTTTPAQLDRTRKLIADLRAEPHLAPRARAEGLTLAGHLLAGADEETGFELMREAMVLWLEYFPNDPNTATAAVGFAQALHYAERDDEARDACRAVRRLTIPLSDRDRAALVELEEELDM